MLHHAPSSSQAQVHRVFVLRVFLARRIVALHQGHERLRDAPITARSQRDPKIGRAHNVPRPPCSSPARRNAACTHFGSLPLPQPPPAMLQHLPGCVHLPSPHTRAHHSRLHGVHRRTDTRRPRSRNYRQDRPCWHEANDCALCSLPTEHDLAPNTSDTRSRSCTPHVLLASQP